jgi:hypothetical protein
MAWIRQLIIKLFGAKPIDLKSEFEQKQKLINRNKSQTAVKKLNRTHGTVRSHEWKY